MAITIDRVIASLGLDRLLEDDSFSYNPRQGVLFNPAQTRYCVLSADLLGGVHQALADEAGEAWTIILKSCGTTWGSRLARRLDRELKALGGIPLGEVPIGEFSQTLQRYFAFHGWGDLSLDLSLAQDRGIVIAELRDSIFAEVIKDSEEMVDWLMSGILASLFSYLSEQELDCVQVSCSSKGAPASRFLISSVERISKASELLKNGSDSTQLAEAI